MPRRSPLADRLAHLDHHSGAPAEPLRRGPYEMILWECAAYLADDAHRTAAVAALRSSCASRCPRRGARSAAFHRSASPVPRRSCCSPAPTRWVALDSNGLRVLLRLGYGAERKSYRAYREVQAAAMAELPADCDTLVRAHLLLRTHGRTLCRATRPTGDGCPLRAGCAHATRAAGRAGTRRAR